MFSICMKSESCEYCGRRQLTESSLCDTCHFESSQNVWSLLLLKAPWPSMWPHLLSCQGPLSHVWRKDLDWCLLSWARKPTGKGKAKSSVQPKDATKCQKIMHLKKLPSTCQDKFLRKLHSLIHILAPHRCVSVLMLLRRQHGWI